MTESNPPGFLQNVATHTAAQLRLYTSSTLGGGIATTAPSFRTRGGVHPMLGALLAVTQNGTPNMTVNVGSGVAYIPGTESSTQALYDVFNDATVNLAIATAPGAGLNRIDLVVAKVQDTFYSGVTNAWSLAVVTGSAAASPSAPAAPANSITLAQVFVGANVTSILTANITDTRFYATALGGQILATSSTRPTTTLIPAGQTLFETDTKFFKGWDGTDWRTMNTDFLWARKTSDQSVISTTTLTNDSALFIPNLAATGVWIVNLHCAYVSNATPAFQVGWSFPAGASLTEMSFLCRVAGPATVTNILPTGGANTGILGSGADANYDSWGLLNTAGTGGTLQFKFAQVTSNATNTTVKAGSYLTLQRIS